MLRSRISEEWVIRPHGRYNGMDTARHRACGDGSNTYQRSAIEWGKADKGSSYSFKGGMVYHFQRSGKFLLSKQDKMFTRLRDRLADNYRHRVNCTGILPMLRSYFYSSSIPGDSDSPGAMTEAIFVLPKYPHLHMVSLLSVIQGVLWDWIIVGGHLIVIAAVLLCMPPPILRCPFPTHLQG